MPWRTQINAEIYDRFVRERAIYEWLNRRIVRLADVPRARRILDLACGTGATTRACLREMDAGAEIVGVDASTEMIEVARANALDPRARFEVGSAAEADRLGGRFDRIVCNAAFWQFPAPAPVFQALERCATPAARWVFNVPAERVIGEPAPIHPFQVTLMREIQSEFGRRVERAPAMIDTAQLASAAREHGFELVGFERHVWEGPQDELMELMSIPAMIVPLTSGLRPEQRDSILGRARQKSDPAQPVRVPWIYFIVERGPDRAVHTR